MATTETDPSATAPTRPWLSPAAEPAASAFAAEIVAHSRVLREIRREDDHAIVLGAIVRNYMRRAAARDAVVVDGQM